MGTIYALTDGDEGSMAFFPRLYDFVMKRAEAQLVGRWRRSVVSPARGRVLEIGAGTGLDFAYYSGGVWVVAIDPDMCMLERARKRAGASAAEIALVVADAEQLPFRAQAFDEAVVGLALCTIPHPELAVAEIRRTVRSGATVRLLEHVRLDHPVWGRVQDALTPAWRRIAGGCHLNRRPIAILAAEGLAIESVENHAGGYVQVIVARTGRDRQK